jgi:hypothetical protein
MIKVKQTAWGTGDTPTIPMPIVGGGGADKDQVIFASERVNADGTANTPKGGSYTYKVPLNYELDPISCIGPFYNLFGKYTYAVDTPVVGANTHTFKFADSAAEFATIHQKGMTNEFYDPSTGNSYTYDSCAINSAAFTTPQDSVIPVALEIFAREETEGSSGETYTPPAGKYILTNYMAALTGGVLSSEVSIPIYDLTFNITRGLVPRHNLTDKDAKRWNQPNNTLVVGGTFKVSREDSERTAIKTAHDSITEQSLIVTYTSDQIITGSTPYSVTFAFQEAFYTKRSAEEQENEEMEMYEFVAAKESISSNVICTVVNAETTL